MYAVLRERMVEKFVIGAGITDPAVISAMRKVPRHAFVDKAVSHQAYQGNSLPIGFGQTISHPTTVAMMSQMLKISGGEKILEIGTGSGYQAAVLTEMGAKVYTIERIPELAQRTRKVLEASGYFSIALRIGDGSVGWSEFAPYQRIIVTAGAPTLPENLLSQLEEEGRLVVPVGELQNQKLCVIDKFAGEIIQKEADWRNFVPLIGQKGWIT
jgi:protein-L-isoaspartate(D-aspartate) O-methyltransferase